MSGGERAPAASAGFTLIEVLSVVLLTGVIVSAMTIVTGQWLKSWNRGAAALQRAGMLTVGLDRLAMDIEGAVAMPANGRRRAPSFLGDSRSLVFVHAPMDQAAPAGLEIVGYGSSRDGVLARSRAPWDPDEPVASINLAGATPLLPAPWRASFAYLDLKDKWVGEWRGERLPQAVRVDLTAPGSGLPSRSLSIAIHAALPAGCASARTYVLCDAFASGRQAPTQIEEYNRRNMGSGAEGAP